jgi:hypothetical protein
MLEPSPILQFSTSAIRDLGAFAAKNVVGTAPVSVMEHPLLSLEVSLIPLGSCARLLKSENFFSY